ncbi:putative MG115-like protein [Streptomyces sp. RB5]|uniref:Putative MG115-like protein n=1 Tax=Streptomyces smaragdinus TaxID=2585196 RepID=A0A7K0CPI6_9ACTN|nr:putative MG115-like protein [Streptomyces smaragdinus]
MSGRGESPGSARAALELLEKNGWSLAVAESLTGGLVAAALTAVPGASRTFRGSVTAYATDLKRDLLGVPGDLLADRGAVDGEVARQMAAGVRWRLGADWGLSTTGVAGPEPQDGQPVGTVFLAAAGPGGQNEQVRLSLEGDRDEIRAATVLAALELLQRVVNAAGGADAMESPAGEQTEENQRSHP